MIGKKGTASDMREWLPLEFEEKNTRTYRMTEFDSRINITLNITPQQKLTEI